MARNSVSEWSTTANENTDVGGINIAEGMPAANVNNAMREMMAQLRTYSNGVGGSLFLGEGAPADTLGVDGDAYIDTLNSDFYGPKAGGAWPSPTSLIGGAFEDPTTYGAATTNTATQNDAAFSTMRAAVGNRTVDLQGLDWPVTSVPAIPGAVNGYWEVENYEDTLTALIPAKDTLERHRVKFDAGARVASWTQGTACAYDGVPRAMVMPADGHNPGQFDVTQIVIDDDLQSAKRIQAGMWFGFTGEIECFASCIVPPVDGTRTAPVQLAIIRRTPPGGDGTTDTMHLMQRTLAIHAQGTGAETTVEETQWSEILFSSNTFGVALRTVFETAYPSATIDPSGLPVLAHALCWTGNSTSGAMTVGFHGLSTDFEGPFLAVIDGTPLDGTATVSAVGRIGNLTEGVEPCPVWVGTTNEYVVFIRSQSSTGYPIRAAVISGGLTQSNIENATVQNAPWGNELGTTSPILGSLRPRRRGNDGSGWVPSADTMNVGTDSTDQLVITFTGTRTRDGSPGSVNQYMGITTRGDSNFTGLFDRMRVILIDEDYFANSNVVDESNQVGIGDNVFVDTNVFMYTHSSEVRAEKGDFDENRTYFTFLRFRDNYAVSTEEIFYDNGTSIPTFTEQLPSYMPYDGVTVSIGESPTYDIASGVVIMDSATGQIDTEGGASVSNLDTIQRLGRDFFPGEIVTINAFSSDRTIDIRDASVSGGNLVTGGTIVLNNARDIAVFQYYESIGQLVLRSFRDNAS